MDNPDPTIALEEAILGERGRLALESRDILGKGAATAVGKMSYIVARANNAKDWFTGHALYKKAIGKSNGLEEHHIFPRAVLYKSGYDTTKDRRIVNEVANRAFLTKPANQKIGAAKPGSYLPLVQKLYPGRSRPRVYQWTQSCGKSRTIGLPGCEKQTSCRTD